MQAKLDKFPKGLAAVFNASQVVSSPSEHIQMSPGQLMASVESFIPELNSTQNDGLASLFADVKTEAPTEQSKEQSQMDGSVESFIKTMSPHAKAVAKKLGTSPKNVIAQWGLETGWGKNILPGTYNLGNIKAGNSWSGPTYALDALEYKNNKATNEASQFRKYGGFDEAAQDYANLIANNERYSNALGKTDPVAYFKALKEGGYATDPNYVKKMKSIIKTIDRHGGL